MIDMGPTKNSLQHGINMKWIAASLLGLWLTNMDSVEIPPMKLRLLVVHMKLGVLVKLDSVSDRVLGS